MAATMVNLKRKTGTTAVSPQDFFPELAPPKPKVQSPKQIDKMCKAIAAAFSGKKEGTVGA